jgi:hypothetical protein
MKPMFVITLIAFAAMSGPARAQTLPAPILFVTQVPQQGDFGNMASTFANHRADMRSAGRGGDLWIRYGDGTLENLTAAAGFGSTDPNGFQGADAIAVRDPAVHWDGQKALFSMVVGAPAVQFQLGTWRWQIYEITGLGKNDTPVVTRLAGQPAAYNNVMPIYGTDDRVIFVSDRPRGGEAHLYPQLDEYERVPTNTGLWRMDPVGGGLEMLVHAPSGDFTPTIDSFGRLVFTQWDHLEQDQEADADAHYDTGKPCDSGIRYGSFNYESEASDSPYDLDDITEVFPEPDDCRTELLAGTGLAGHGFNHFFPWTAREDGTEVETLNHLGRHELHSYIPSSRIDDPNVEDFYGQYARTNPDAIGNTFQIREDPTVPGRYFMVDAPEFQSHASGQIVRIDAPPTLMAEDAVVENVTHPDTGGFTPTPEHSGHYRDPLPLSNGRLLAAHSGYTGPDGGGGSPTASHYDFRLRLLESQPGGYSSAGPAITPGISKTLSYWSPDALITFSGTMWETSPVEVIPRPRPTAPEPALPQPEQQMFDAAGVSVSELRAFLKASDLALIVTRDVTRRDDFDLQQPTNLRIPGGVEALAAPGTVYDVRYLQLFQADQVRGSVGNSGSTPQPGRRVLARPLHDPAATAVNPPSPGPAGSVVLGQDGSMAAFVPARRAMTWQLTDPDGEGVVRERYWVSFQPGEVRVCTNCHGLSEVDQVGDGPSLNPPQALLDLLLHWKSAGEPVCSSGIGIQDARLFLQGERFSMKTSGNAIFPEPWIGVDPAANGFRFAVEGLLDARIPGGAPWRTAASGTKWTYRDAVGSRGGVVRATLRKSTGGRVSWKIVAKAPKAVLPDAGSVSMGIVVGQECAALSWNGPAGPSPRCTGDATRIVCR